MSWAMGSRRAYERSDCYARIPAPQDSPEHASELSQLAQAAGAGDDEAFDGLLRRMSQLIHRYCRSRLAGLPGGDQSAEDAAQEACLSLIEMLPKYRASDGPFEALLYTVASRRVVDQQRVSYRVPMPIAQIPEEAASLPTPEEHALARDEASRVRDLLGHLSDVHREILTLRVAVGMSADEVASAMGMTPGAVRVAQHRAIARLRDLMNVHVGKGYVDA